MCREDRMSLPVKTAEYREEEVCNRPTEGMTTPTRESPSSRSTA
jgi:hypothetical protein